MIGEGTLFEPTHVEHPEEAVAGEQGDTQHHLDALLPEDRVRDLRGCVDALERRIGPLGGCDPTCEAAPDRNSNALAHLLLDPASCGCDEILLALRDQQDCCGVGIECSCTRLNNSSSSSSTCSVVIAESVSACKRSSCTSADDGSSITAGSVRTARPVHRGCGSTASPRKGDTGRDGSLGCDAGPGSSSSFVWASNRGGQSPLVSRAEDMTTVETLLPSGFSAPTSRGGRSSRMPSARGNSTARQEFRDVSVLWRPSWSAMSSFTLAAPLTLRLAPSVRTALRIRGSTT